MEKVWEMYLKCANIRGIVLFNHRNPLKLNSPEVFRSYPSPVSAQQDCMCQGWSLMELRVRYLEISAADMQSFMSCLLANISTAAFRRSWTENNKPAWSSSAPWNMNHLCGASGWFYLMSQHPVELLLGDGQSLSVCAVHHQNDELRSKRNI